jgi:DNA polymerase (family 10)
MIPNREAADLDMDAILSAAAKHGVVLEINAHPARLDLNDVHARQAMQTGARLCINTDAHDITDLDMLPYGIATARRGWVERQQVVNTWDTEHILDWLAERG